jgi:hypothetical protein
MIEIPKIWTFCNNKYFNIHEFLYFQKLNKSTILLISENQNEYTYFCIYLIINNYKYENFIKIYNSKINFEFNNNFILRLLFVREIFTDFFNLEIIINLLKKMKKYDFYKLLKLSSSNNISMNLIRIISNKNISYLILNNFIVENSKDNILSVKYYQ